ncbi:MAG TPA: flavodoxin [Rhodocyclaceae bacterium]|nr:flavodoxin [Rhodocyclaceae bacterium]
MGRIGIYFGTDTGRTRRIAKLIAKKLGDQADAPVNVGRCAPADLLKHRALILGSPTYGDGELPGRATGLHADSWAEFLPGLRALDLRGVTAAIFGLGEQEKYPGHFVDGIAAIHDAVTAAGATVVGATSPEGYRFTRSAALRDGRLLGLALDPVSQDAQTEARVDAWLAAVAPRLLDASEGRTPDGR